MERRRIAQSETRLMLLYVLLKVGPASGQQLEQFMADTNTMNYFDLQLNLISLLDDGAVEKLPHPVETVYRLTDSGRFTVESYINRLPVSRRDEVDLQAGAAKENFLRELEAPAKLEKLGNGQNNALLYLMQGNEALLELRLPLNTGERWPLLHKRWQRCAAAAYQKVILALTGAAARDQTAEGITVLERHGPAWAMSGEREDGFRLKLLFAEQRAAEEAAGRFPHVSGQLLRELKSMLDGEITALKND